MKDDQKSAAERPTEENASPAIQADEPEQAANARRPRGKMYWKFATLEGWQAPKNDPAKAQESDDD